MTGNIKESLIPYIKENMKQLKLIDKSKKQDLTSEPNKDIISDLKRLQLYANNYINKWHNLVHGGVNENESRSNTNESENAANTDEDESQSLSQAEVESLMPSVNTCF